MTDRPAILDPTKTAVAELAAKYREANGVGIKLLNFAGGKAENLLSSLPPSVKSELDKATIKALELAVKTATNSRTIVPDQPAWVNTLTTAAMGAVGGAGGIPSAVAELPVTTTVLLRVIQGVAAEHGFDPQDPDVQSQCIHVFSAAGPMTQDDGADLGFLMTRLTLTGGAVQKILAQVAPKLAASLGQKLALQAVPVMGAVTGAAINYTFTQYYQQIAHVQFGLRRLAIESGTDHALLVSDFKELVQLKPARS